MKAEDARKIFEDEIDSKEFRCIVQMMKEKAKQGDMEAARMIIHLGVAQDTIAFEYNQLVDTLLEDEDIRYETKEIIERSMSRVHDALD